MKIYYKLTKDTYCPDKTPLVLTIGIFDGVHCGHQQIIKYAVNLAGRLGGKSGVMTFDPHPLKIIDPRRCPPILISLEHRLRLIRELGVDVCFALKFNKQLAAYSAERFVRQILVKGLNVKHLVVGWDFVFGREEGGNVKLLEKMGREYGFKVHTIGKITLHHQKISSTRIRSLIEQGKLVLAGRFIGRRVSILGTVVEGNNRGRALGFPTANIDPHHEAIPPCGVYAVEVKYDEKFYHGMLNIGQRPTFGRKHQGKDVIEVHLFDFKGNLYGEDIEVFFLKQWRKEKVFKTPEELSRQLSRDEQGIRRYLVRCNSL